MRSFKYECPGSIEEATAIMKKNPGNIKIIAGGTDLLGILKGEIMPNYPDSVIDIGKIPGLDGVSGDKHELRIGALARLEKIGSSEVIRKYYGVLSEAARSVGSPQIRNMGTIGGNLCQGVRCWYYRAQGLGHPYTCIRKGGETCFAMTGDNRYHAIINGGPCFAVCPSDTATALLALDGKIRTYKSGSGGRIIPIKEFYSNQGNKLDADEIVVEIQIPGPPQGARHFYRKFRLRKAIDFAVVSVALIAATEDRVCRYARIVLGGVAPMPIRAVKAEEKVAGHRVDEINIADATEAALADAEPLSRNSYKVEIAKRMVGRAIMALI
ncbi:MAG: xanthine dehydrogenase family protein subunit M [Syntrophales bacterium]